MLSTYYITHAEGTHNNLLHIFTVKLLFYFNDNPSYYVLHDSPYTFHMSTVDLEYDDILLLNCATLQW